MTSRYQSEPLETLPTSLATSAIRDVSTVVHKRSTLTQTRNAQSSPPSSPHTKWNTYSTIHVTSTATENTTYQLTASSLLLYTTIGTSKTINYPTPSSRSSTYKSTASSLLLYSTIDTSTTIYSVSPSSHISSYKSTPSSLSHSPTQEIPRTMSLSSPFTTWDTTTTIDPRAASTQTPIHPSTSSLSAPSYTTLETSITIPTTLLSESQTCCSTPFTPSSSRSFIAWGTSTSVQPKNITGGGDECSVSEKGGNSFNLGYF